MPLLIPAFTYHTCLYLWLHCDYFINIDVEYTVVAAVLFRLATSLQLQVDQLPHVLFLALTQQVDQLPHVLFLALTQQVDQLPHVLFHALTQQVDQLPHVLFHALTQQVDQLPHVLFHALTQQVDQLPHVLFLALTQQVDQLPHVLFHALTQQEPQLPWSRISPTVGHLGQATRASKLSGTTASSLASTRGRILEVSMAVSRSTPHRPRT